MIWKLFGLELELEASGFIQWIGFLITLGYGEILVARCCTMLVMRFVLLVGLCCGLVVDPMSSWVLLLCYEKFMENCIFGYFELVEHVSLSCVGNYASDGYCVRLVYVKKKKLFSAILDLGCYNLVSECRL